MGGKQITENERIGPKKNYPDLTAPIDEMEDRRPEQNEELLERAEMGTHQCKLGLPYQSNGGTSANPGGCVLPAPAERRT